MYLYSLTIKQPTSIHKVISGSFSAPKVQELLVARSKILELYQQDESTGSLVKLLSFDVFGIIRALSSFRLYGTNRDLILLGTDSGRIVVLQYNPEKNCFEKLHQETYGKTGVRRIVPGQYISTDPLGRAFMISAIEKQKFVYILNRDVDNKLTISSPLDAHKSHTIIYDTCGLDAGHNNPLFGVIESDYGEIDEFDASVITGEIKKSLTFYEMDLGLNHVIRKSTSTIENSATNVLSVPFGNDGKDGPGGVIVLCEDLLIYRSYPPKIELKCKYPKRLGIPPGDKVLINSSALHKQKALFFYLIQTEHGDLFKVSLNHTGKEVHSISVQYLDSIHPANSLSILKSGYLFAAADSGNHTFWKFKSLGDKDQNPKICSSADEESKEVVFFPKPLENLKLVEEWQNLSVISDVLVEDLIGDNHPQIYALCGAGNRSSLRVLRHGLTVTEVANSNLPKKPSCVWTLKEKSSDEFDKYIILSFQKNTLVLLIGEKVVDVKDTPLETKKATVLAALLQDDSIIQVLSTGIRHIKSDGKVSEWQAEQGKIVNAVANQKQLAISIQGGELVYFELDSEGTLQEKERTVLDSEILCMSIGDIPKERQRTKFLACGFVDNTVKLFSLDIDSCLLKLSHQSLPMTIQSVCLIEYNDPSSRKDSEDDSHNNQLFLHVGCINGSFFKTSVEKLTGSLTETRSRFLGTDPVKLFRIRVGDRNALMALSSRPWISYLHKESSMVTPLICKSLDFVWGFQSSMCSDGVVGIKDNSLRIFKVNNLGDLFSETSMPLRYLPRKILCHAESQNLIIMEGMHRTYSESENKKVLMELREKYPNEPNFSENQKLVAPEGTWASCIRIVSPFSMSTTNLHELKNNETAISMSIVNFDQYQEDTFLLVGTIKDYVMVPKSFSGCFIHTFWLENGGKNMQLLHTTTMDGIPYSLAPHNGKLLAGIGYMLRLYDIGKKQLLKKCEYKHLYMGVTNIKTCGERIFVTDASDSFHLLKHKPRENQFVEIADDVLPRWITAVEVLDYHTLVGADKFENVFVCRLPESVDEEINEDFFSYKFKWEAGYLNGTACKYEQICNYFFGEVVTSICKTSLTSTSQETIFLASTNGSLAVLCPFETKEEVDFFVHLEMYMRMEAQPLSGRDHSAFRSYHGAVKNVVDGDLCEQFGVLSPQSQALIAEEVDRKPLEVNKKLEDIRNRVL